MRVDRSALKVNQAFITALTVLGFVLGEDHGGVWVILFTGLVMAVGTVVPSLALFQQVYHRILKPAGIVKPHIVAEDPAPHRFAQGLGSVFLLAGVIFLAADIPVAGWTLSWIVTFLAVVNLTVNFCAGCFMYFQLERLGLFHPAGRA